MEYHLILNPAAGRGAGQKSEPYLLELFETNFPGFQFHKTTGPGHATRIAKNIKNDEAFLIAAGGDGTVHEVVNGITPGNCTLGVIPIGSGNDFIKMLSLSKDLKSAIEIIRNNKTICIDVGKVNDRYFSNCLGIGFDAAVVMETSKTKYARGFLIYLFAVFRALKYYQNRTVNFHLNGKTETKDIFMINVGNGAVFGGGFQLTPDAKIDDGQLDVCIFNSMTKREVILNLPKGISGKHIHLPQVQMHKTDRLVIESDSGLPVHCDGELISPDLKKVDIRILPEALKVIHNIRN